MFLQKTPLREFRNTITKQDWRGGLQILLRSERQNICCSTEGAHLASTGDNCFHLVKYFLYTSAIAVFFV